MTRRPGFDSFKNFEGLLDDTAHLFTHFWRAYADNFCENSGLQCKNVIWEDVVDRMDHLQALLPLVWSGEDLICSLLLYIFSL